MGRVGTGKGAAGNGTGIVGAHVRVAIRSDAPEETVVDPLSAGAPAALDHERSRERFAVRKMSSGCGQVQGKPKWPGHLGHPAPPECHLCRRSSRDGRLYTV